MSRKFFRTPPPFSDRSGYVTGSEKTFSVLIFFFLTAAPAYALQTHGSPEGLYVHQGAHILYFLSMLGFAYKILKSDLGKNRAWKHIAYGACLLAAWNIWAFSGHIATSLLPPDSFVTSEGHGPTALIARTANELTYYILKIDHLLCVPALFCFYLGLRLILSRMPEKPQKLPARTQQK
ncbi:MAG TPA: hypothetical protein EYP57_01120 [Thermodesulfobacteriaceae bacterium]|nr:hypothetical protein [Thermodesulfobacteriaceae bacterium]